MPIPRFRRTTRSRSRDDDDWGTSSPAAIMKPLPQPLISAVLPETSAIPQQQAQSSNTNGNVHISVSNSNNLLAPTPKATASSAQQQQRQEESQTQQPRQRHQHQQHFHQSGEAVAVAFAKLQQQDLKSYTTTFSPRCVISLYFIMAVLFLPLGVLIVAGTANLRSHGPIKYNNDSILDSTATYSIKPPRTIRAPSYLYYSLTNYHQNTREYVKSRSDLMNQGIMPTTKLDVENCEDYLCKDGGMGCLRFENNESLDVNSYIYPCGLTAWSFFNDTFQLCAVSSSDSNVCNNIPLSNDNIAWWTDAKYKFKPNLENPNYIKPNVDLLNRSANELLENPHFVVWMRLSAFSTFFKLYGVINQDLEASQTYNLVINNFYPVEGYKGTKRFYITETTWFGDANPFLGTAYLLVGVVSLIVAIFLLTKHISGPLNPGAVDPAILLREHLAKFEKENAAVQPLHLN